MNIIDFLIGEDAALQMELSGLHNPMLPDEALEYLMHNRGASGGKSRGAGSL